MTGLNLNDAFFLDGVMIPGPGKTGSRGSSEGSYATGAVHFDGETFLRLVSLAATDSTQLLLSYWAKNLSEFGDVSPGIVWSVDWDNNNSLRNYYTSPISGNNPSILLADTPDTGSDVLVENSSAAWAADTWHHVCACFDVDHAAGLRLIGFFIDDADASDIVTDTGAAFTLIANALPFNIFGTSDPLGLIGDFADFWWGLDQFLDITVTANRRKFISETGKPVDLGADGSTPTGTAPTLFLRRDPDTGTADDFKTDKSGTGNDFTVTGTLTDASSSPSD